MKCLKSRKVAIITKKEKEKQLEFLSSYKAAAQNREVGRGLSEPEMHQVP